ncbi:hypothetical protein BC826DRAFT_1110222 [Russula brevipes]|nr:hypothetical protein BC826DRAFT_1110222 [Russula brevipes]
MDVDILDSTPTTSKAGSAVYEVRESVHPNTYRSYGGNSQRIRSAGSCRPHHEAYRDEVLWEDAYKPWRRSPLWLIFRVSLQTSLRASNLYKHFIPLLSRPSSAQLQTDALLSKRWLAFQDTESIRPPLRSERLDFVADSNISLHNSYDHLTKILLSASHGFSHIRFTPSHGSRLHIIRDFTQFSGGELTRAISKDQRIAIADFELSVEKYLESWVAASTNNERAVDVIASCIQQYFAGTKNLYGVNPEDNSIMILTIMDLWKSKSLLAEASRINHKRSKDGEIHSNACQKCRLENQAESLIIHVHELPLSSSVVNAQLTVFELSPPHAFAIWRDITYMILHDIARPSVPDSHDQPKIMLDSFSGLRRWAVQDHRVTLGSTTKSFSDQTHYKTTSIPAEESSVLVNNGLSFRLYDRNHGSWVIESLSESSVKKLCTPPIPTSSPYTQLHLFVSGTQHRPNDIIAAQADCPKEISLHEFIAFAGLRSGPRLQWLNIARELASPFLSFRREEVHTLITQAAWQLGPLVDGVREWHVDLNISSFGKVLLGELESLLQKIKANWLEEVTVRTIVLISSRLLASVTDLDLSDRACEKLDSTQDETSRAGLQYRLCMLATTCFSTFDVCSNHVPTTLVSDEDVFIAMRCAVIVHDYAPLASSHNNSPYLTRMLCRHSRLLHSLEPIFSQQSGAELLHASAYDRALAQLWPGYRRRVSSKWRALPEPNFRWITCLAEGGQDGQDVHYDLLTGQLLIDGKPLGRLPQKMVEHPTYTSVLGTRILDVGPADIPGMEFMTRSTVSGYQIIFSWNDGDLVLQARTQRGSKMLQLIPRSKLSGDFPRYLVDKHTHWFDLTTCELEFRPAGSPWTSGPSNWRLCVNKPGIHPRAILQKPSQDGSPIQLIDICSPTFAEVSGLLSPLESPNNIIATFYSQTLEVSLPRLHLSFFVNANWELECRNMPGYVIDKTQSCGTMFGLRNKLILCPSSNHSEELLLPRRVIIPQGDIVFGTRGDFTSVSITTDAEEHVRWHEYTIDNNLKCLTSNAGLSRKLYQCYLHALTSHCLPDPLLGHTGTEEALHILRSAACISFQRLGVHEAELLKSISNLSPNRVYYPPHLQSMVTVKWNNLPALSQHHGFYRTACSLLAHARELEVLYDQPAVFNIPDRDQSLLNWAAFRNKSYYPSDLEISEQSSPSSLDDVQYRSRAVSDDGTAEHVAYRTSWSMWNARPSLNGRVSDLWDMMNSWRSLGPADGGISPRYSRYWLNFDASRDWLVIYDLCRNALNGNLRNNRIELSFSLSAAAYSKHKYADVVPFITVFALDERCRNLSPPPDTSYTFSDGVAPSLTQLKVFASESALPIYSTPAISMEVGAINSFTARKWRNAEYHVAINRESSEVAQSVLRQWPDYGSVDFREQWLNKSDCIRRLQVYMCSISRNKQLRGHVLQLQSLLQEYENVSTPTSRAAPYVHSPQFATSNSKALSFSIRDVFVSRTNTPTPSPERETFLGRIAPLASASEDSLLSATSDSLEILVEELRHSKEPLLQLYGNDLNESHCELLRQNVSQPARGAIPSHELHEILRLHRCECFQRRDKIFSEISAALAPSQNVEKINGIAGLWPRITPRSVLRQLAQDRISILPDQWKSVIMRYAISLLKYQQSLRLLELSSRKKYEELLRETEAIRNGDLAKSSPDWLLVQIEANLLARPVQIAVAREMISPSVKRNISIQLNMGEGKSSVIVPLVALTLADGSNLMRIVTLEPLSNQMFQLLVGRLSGLANRPIFYIPFSRGLHMNTSMVSTISGLYRRCVAEGGVLVVQPEHILSQKLMHIDSLLTSHGNDEKRRTAHELRALQEWMAKVSRDVLDESDEILHVQYQLIYTAGEDMPVDDHPNRWTTIQQVFGRLKVHAVKLHARIPMMFEIDHPTPRGFPIIRILDSSIFREISSLIIDDAIEGGLPNLPLNNLPSLIKGAARRFMAQREVSEDDYQLIHSHCAGTTWLKGMLLLRGLLMVGDGILGYVLKERRWRVDYGLDPSRTLLAVPYRAKDVPSLRADFSHPDVAIALTCLSYYYGGLTKDQVLFCFELLGKLDNPEMEYWVWVESGQDIPAELRQLNGVNTEDETQVDEFLVPLFSRNTGVIDFYLSQLVFPRAAREFPSKLPTSAWDLVEDKENVTTGFSGTNDNRYLLPTSITQEDPGSLLFTNALVLRHLLRPENDHYQCTEGDNGEPESATAFLQRLVNQDPEIRVLLDVGAQMLELQNEELARRWLSLRPDVSAAIFFNDLDHLTVVTTNGTIEPFISSPFNRQLEKCVVYLDDAHTRGTDLKLPIGMRAAVTLGPKVTKDRLVQGCMRMRQLGKWPKGHSVMFFAPGDVDRHIRRLIPGGTSSGSHIRVLDVLRWAMHETCEAIRHYLPLWAQQGLDHHKRFAAYKEHNSTGDVEVLQKAWLQSESRTLEEMYPIVPGTGTSPEMDSVPLISERIAQLGVTKLVDVRMAEEQEREVDHEIERERQVERPPKVQPAQHAIHEDIREFVNTGKLPQFSRQILPLLAPIDVAMALESTTEWSPSPLATADFTTTTVYSSGTSLTDYLRPVNWILSSRSGKDSIVLTISPYEADELLPIIRKSKKVRLHLYSPRVTSSMRSFSDLTFHSIPDSPAEPWLAPAHIRTELNLFAGQLYFDSRGDYERVCVLLALSMAHPGAEYSELDGENDMVNEMLATAEKRGSEMVTVEFKSGGADISHAKGQLDSFMNGFDELIPHELIAVSDEQELGSLICRKSEIDMDDWMEFTNYVGTTKVEPEDEVIQWFWKGFATGTSRIPPNGFKDLPGPYGPLRFTI